MLVQPIVVVVLVIIKIRNVIVAVSFVHRRVLMRLLRVKVATGCQFSFQLVFIFAFERLVVTAAPKLGHEDYDDRQGPQVKGN